jgi:hypothetical protein
MYTSTTPETNWALWAAAAAAVQLESTVDVFTLIMQNKANFEPAKLT